MKKLRFFLLFFLLLGILDSQVSFDVYAQSTENDEKKIIREEGLENSWRYSNGEWLYSYSNLQIYDENSWNKVDGNYVNNRGEIIPGAIKKGIDVSEHNSKINWELVKNDGIEFAILRCGYGQDIESQDDKEWLNNVAECERLNIPFGVYLYSYADTIEKAESEAQHVIRLLQGHNPALPIYYDLEENSMLSLSSSERGNIAKTFCSILENNGYSVGIYSNLNWWNNYLLDDVFNNEKWSKWVAQYNYKCDYANPYDIWQATATGKVDGIKGNVDINFLMDTNNFSNDKEELLMIQYNKTFQKWCLYTNGIINFDFTGIVENANGWWYIQEGIVADSYSGMVENANGWWYIRKGKIDVEYTGIVEFEGEYYYIRKGKWDSTYTGIVENVNGWWYIQEGKIVANYIGMVENPNGWWYIRKGKIDIEYTGIVEFEGEYYYIRKGKWDSAYTGIVENANGWWYIRKGKIDVGYTGVVEFEGQYYYIRNGKWDSTYKFGE